MRALVTGVAGFIGSAVARRLLADGHDVVGLDDLSDGREDNLGDLGAMTFLRHDLRDLESVRTAAEGSEVIFHLGAKRSVQRSESEPALFTEVNVGGTSNVLIAAREGGARVVSASSSSVYGDQERFPLEESMIPRPRSHYAVTKLAGEVLVEGWARAFGVAAVSLRYFNVYGPGMDPAGDYALLVPRVTLASLRDEAPVIFGDGEQSRDFTYVDDVVEANLRAAEAAPSIAGQTFNVGGGATPTTVNEIVATIGELTGTDIEPRREPTREGDVRRTEADVTRAREAFGYAPTVGIREGLARTVEDLRRRFGA